MPTIGDVSTTQSLLNNLKQAAQKESGGLTPLASGSKINSAKDDAAGLIISEQLLAELTALDQTARNTSDGISLVQVADGGLNSISENLSRIRELSLQAANGVLGPDQRNALQSEVSQLQQEISDVIDRADFNGVELFKNNVNLNLQVGTQGGETLAVPLQDLSTSLAPVAAIDVSTAAGASSALAALDAAANTVDSFRGDLGAIGSRAESVINTNRVTAENIAAFRSRITDTDFAQAASEQLRQSLLSQTGNAIQAQANVSSQLVISLLS